MTEAGSPVTSKIHESLNMANQAEHLALILKAIEDEEMNFAEERTSHKDRLERLHNFAYKLRCEILGGQMSLVPEPEPPKEGAA